MAKLVTRLKFTLIVDLTVLATLINSSKNLLILHLQPL